MSLPETATITKDQSAVILTALTVGFSYFRSMAEALDAAGELTRSNPLAQMLIAYMEENLQAREILMNAFGVEV